jgi:ABC-2 type transport system permease protein
MTHWFEVFRFELRQQFRRKGYLFITFIVPALAIVIFWAYQLYQDLTEDDSGGETQTVLSDENEADQTVGYVDQTPNRLFPAPASYGEVDCTPQPLDGESASETAKRVLSPGCWSGSIIYYADLESGEQALDDGDIDALYVIEPDYVETGDVSIYISGFSIEAAESEGLMSNYMVRSLLHDLTPEDFVMYYGRLLFPANINSQQITETGETTEAEDEGQNYATIYAFGLAMMFSLLWGGGYLMQSAVQEKESRIVEIIVSSVRPTALFLGKILAMGALSLLQIAILMGTLVYLGSQVGDIISGLDNIDIAPFKFAIIAIYFVLGFLFFGSMMAAIGAISTSVRESQNFVVFVTLPAAIPFFFLTIIAEEPNGSFATTLSLIPFTSALTMTMRLTITDVPAGEVALSLALLVAGVVFVIWLSGRLFRVNTLLSGQMPRLRDIPKLIRG